ncbi:MAG: DUF3015 family protein [Nitrospiraceae bacterium]|nr:DUF3015 family protein [Nitrospiraceae bacterium]
MTTQVAVLMFALAFLVGSVSCDLTTELTKVPLDVTSTIVRPTGEFTSSTSPGAESFIRGAKARRQLEILVASSFEDVRADIARGNGEYLGSIAVLAGVPPASHARFQRDMQMKYDAMYPSSLPIGEAGIRVVDTAWSAGYGR